MTNFMDGVLLSRTKYNYDAKGRLTSWESYDGAGNPRHKAVQRYRDNGGLADITSHNKDGLVMYKQVYAYDAHDRVTKSTSYGDKGQILEKQTFGSDPNVILITRGNRTLRIVLKEKVKDQLDEHGNWQRSKQEKVVNDTGKLSELVEITVRKFTYQS